MAGPSRRSLLTALGFFPLAACKPIAPPRPGAVEISLPSVPVGGRLVMQVRDLPVEVRRTEVGVFARSLQCTHWGCRVRWSAASGHYECPCHDGRYDADGRPVAGPPTMPLRDVAVAVSGARVIVGS